MVMSLMTTGSITIRSTTGKMKSPSGRIIFTESLLAASSARNKPPIPHVFAEYPQRLADVATKLQRLPQHCVERGRFIVPNTLGLVLLFRSIPA
jgi:hypothetical protein